jgi:hypothetical protein
MIAARAGFVATMLVNSFDLTPPPDRAGLIQTTSYPLTIAAAHVAAADRDDPHTPTDKKVAKFAAYPAARDLR